MQQSQNQQNTPRQKIWVVAKKIDIFGHIAVIHERKPLKKHPHDQSKKRSWQLLLSYFLILLISHISLDHQRQ
jgi:hypothetical protein